MEDSDFYQKGKGIGVYLRKLQNKTIELPNSYVTKLLDGPEYWPSGTSLNKELVVFVARENLLPLLNKIVTCLDEKIVRYNTAKEILKNIHTLGILSDLSNKISQYRIQRNTFLLSDSGVLIYKIIDGNEAPFIYEKMGNRYNHFLIDEFQDTSTLQWSNFKPLIRNSLSEGYNCLLVGDVKQSIKVWRNSNWEILAEQISKDFQKELIQFETLEKNWRSQRNIVEFNNNVFPAALDIIWKDFVANAKEYLDSRPGMKNLLSNIYTGLEQAIPDSDGKGNIKIRPLSKQEVHENIDHLLEFFFNDIDELLQAGYSAGDIAVLVRGKKEGRILADHLIRQNAEGRFSRRINVISDESLFLSASNVVNLIISAMQYFVRPDDDINRGRFIACFVAHQKKLSEDIELEDLEFISGISSKEKIINSFSDEFSENIDSLIALPSFTDDISWLCFSCQPLNDYRGI
ncbi:RecBCD enzyme subunit RecB [subsurface metagenome]